MEKCRQIALISAILALSGCATAAFDPPPYSYRTIESPTPVDLDVSNVKHVTSYIRGATDTFDRMIRNAERVKHATELPIIGAGIVAPVGLALGNNTDMAIYSAGVGAAGGALSGYLGLRGREKLVAQARGAATCINHRFIDQIVQGRSAAMSFQYAQARNGNGAIVTLADNVRTSSTGDDLNDISSMMGGRAAVVASDVSSAGSVAIAAIDEIISRLKIKLSDMGQVPDYAAIFKDMQQKQALATAKTAQAKQVSETSGVSDAQVEALAQYQVDIAQCLAKFP